MKILVILSATICLLISGCKSSDLETEEYVEKDAIPSMPIEDCTAADLFKLIYEFRNENSRYPTSLEELKQFHSSRDSSEKMSWFTSLSFHVNADNSQTINWESPTQIMTKGTLTIIPSGEGATWTEYDLKEGYIESLSNQ